MQALNYVQMSLGENNHYYTGFRSKVQTGAYPIHVQTGISFLKALIVDVQSGVFNNSIEDIDTSATLSNLFAKFHSVAVQLRKRHNGRATLDIEDEYDVQDLMHALLQMRFNDVQREEFTTSFGGTASRMDFALREHNTIVETKMTRKNLKNRELTDQIINDTTRYQTYHGCQSLYCFVYDPAGYISNPIGLERDLSGRKGNIDVTVTVCPKL